MPQFEEFFDQYLAMRDQMDSLDSHTILDLDQKMPQFVGEGAPRLGLDPLVSVKTEFPNFLDMTSFPCAFPTATPVTSSNPPSSSSPSSLYSSNSSTSPTSTSNSSSITISNHHHQQHSTSSTSTSTTTTTSSSSNSGNYSYDHHTGAKCFVAGNMGAGCTLIEGGTAAVSSLAEQQLDSPDLFDLDNQSPAFYDDVAASVKPLKALKVEPQAPGGVDMDVCGGLVGHGFLDAGNDQAAAAESWRIAQIRNEIEYDCQMLVCSNDPSTWCEEEVQEWVTWICRKYRFDFPPDCKALFNIRGELFCQMVQDDFRWRLPQAGSFLHQQLEVWKMACKLTSDAGGHDVMYSTPPPHSLPTPTPSISPAPSTGSTCSTMSSSSSAGAFASDSVDEDVFSSFHPFSKPSLTAPRASPTPAPTPARQQHSTSHVGPRQPKQTIHLWQFLRELLDDPENYHCCIKWTDRNRGVFKIEDSSKVAKLWGRRKNRPAMNYDKLSRSVRQYYKKGIIKKTEQSKRLVYQFCQPYL